MDTNANAAQTITVQTIAVTITRSAEYLRTRALATGESQPQSVIVNVPIAQLSDSVRQVLLSLGSTAGIYPVNVTKIRYSPTYEISPHSTYGYEAFQLDAEQSTITLEDVDRAITTAIASISAQRVKHLDNQEECRRAVAAKAEREETERLALAAARDAIAQKFFSDPQARAQVLMSHPYGAQWSGTWFPSDHPLTSEATRRAKTDAEAAAQRKSIQIAEWVATQGTQNQQERLAAGLLPEDEVIDAFRATTFAPTDEIPRYVRITATEVRALCDDDDADERRGEDVRFTSKSATFATSAQWALISRLQEIFGSSATIVLKEHRGSWDCGNEDHDLHELERDSVLVTATVGEITVSREFAA